MELLSSRSWPQIPKIQNNRGVSRIPYLSCVLCVCSAWLGSGTKRERGQIRVAGTDGIWRGRCDAGDEASWIDGGRIRDVVPR
jgi:hypothetical protein